jgi:hypothetical protein
MIKSTIKFKTVPLIIIIIILCLLFTGASAVNVLSAVPSSITVKQGSNTTVKIIADELPYGILGYDLKVTMSDASAAKIVSVTYPSWATISNTTQLPSASVRISAVDLNGLVNSGSKDVELATLTIQGDKDATTDVVLSAVYLDYNGPTLTATPATPVPTVSGTGSNGGVGNAAGGSSSGSSGGYSSAGNEGSATTAAVKTTSNVTTTVTPVGTGQKASATQVAATPAVITPEKTSSPITTPVTPANKGIFGVVQGPILILGVIIALIAACGLLYLTHKKKI